MTLLDIFIFASFTILILILKNYYEKYESTQELLEVLANEIEEHVFKIKSYETKLVELSCNLDAKQKEHNSEKLLLKEQFSSETKDLKHNINKLIADLDKQKVQHAISLAETAEQARKDALKRSRAVIRGQASEHLAPYVIKNTNPKDYRFMGNPVDYICFDGLSDVLDGKANEINKILFVDIKTGKSNLNKSQRRIRDAIEDSRVQFSVINLDKEIEKQDDKVKEKPSTSGSEES